MLFIMCITAVHIVSNIMEIYQQIQTEELVQDVQIKSIQNKIIISQKAFTIHIYGLHHYKGKPSQLFLSI
jgi:hypothetical protein